MPLDLNAINEARLFLARLDQENPPTRYEPTWNTPLTYTTVSSSTGTNASERDYSQGEVASASPEVRLVPESEYARSIPRRDAQGRFASIAQDPQTNVSPIPDKPGIKGWFSKLDRMAA